MTALAQIEETLSKLTACELAEVQAMLDRLQKSEASGPVQIGATVMPKRPDRSTFEEIEPLLAKAALTEDELENLERHNGFFSLRKRAPGPPITVEMVRQLMEEEGI